MQNSLSYFHPDYSNYPISDEFLANAPDLSIESEVFGPTSSTAATMNNMQMPMHSQTTASVAATPVTTTGLKRKGTIDTDASFSPTSIYSDNSNYSDTFYPPSTRRSVDYSQGFPSMSGRGTTFSTGGILSSSSSATPTGPSHMGTSAEEGSSDDNDDDEEENSLARKREKHTKVEAQRRALEKAHFRELSLLITNRNDSKSTKLHHLDLLKIAADQITEMNARHKHDPLRPSNLTDSELNFLTIEASNSFLFVTTMDPSNFRIIHVTESINRVLHYTAEQWHRQNFLSFVHNEDVIRVQSQLMSINPSIGVKVHIDCRLKQGQSDRYSLVSIDGMTKKLDQTLRPVQSNAPGFVAFVGICHLPLITKYSETNMSLHNNPQQLIFRCRCSPHDWKIFLVDRSISTFPSISYDLIRQKSILEFIHPNDQSHVNQILLRSTTIGLQETISCHFVHPNSQTIIPMSLEVKSFFNQALHRADFIELTFKNYPSPVGMKLDTTFEDFFNDTKAIDDLLKSENPSVNSHSQPLIEPSLHIIPTTNTTNIPPYYYTNDWSTKK